MIEDGVSHDDVAFLNRVIQSSLDDAAAGRLFAALGDGGVVTMPLAKTFFASSFGMVNDRFGVSWMVMVQG